AVLRLLVGRAGELVTKEELWAAVWPRVVVTDGALSVCIAEVRRVLGDNARKPRFVATVAKRGFRFVCPISSHSAHKATVTPQAALLGRPPLVSDTCVGRASELGAMQDALTLAGRGARRLVLVSGEPGIGKTTVLEAFKDAIAEQAMVWVLSGQCSPHFGPREPYLPLLDALGRASRDEHGATIVRCLAHAAPLWLAQLPWLAVPEIVPAAPPPGARPTPERMLRELAEAIELLGAEATLVLCLEDLHWSDNSTLDWLNFVMRRDTAARLLVIATFRDAPAIRSDHPLHALRPLPQCIELALGPLTVEAIAEYIGYNANVGSSESVSARSISALAVVLRERTAGNPLFVVNVLDHLASLQRLNFDEGHIEAMIAAVTEHRLPVDLQQSIALQFSGLSRQERDLLETASVAGERFSTAVIAAALDLELHEAERACEEAAQETRMIVSAGLAEWPDGTIATRYDFKHSLYRELLYAGISPGRAASLHRAMGHRLELAFESRTGEIASEIALHYERGHAAFAAARFYLLAGQTALGRAAREAIHCFEKALALLERVPEGRERDVAELQTLTRLGPALMVLKGWSTDEVGTLYERANALAAALGDSPDLVPTLAGIWMFNMTSARYDLADTVTDRLFHIARLTSDEDVLLQAHHARWPILFFRGDLVAASEHVGHGLDLYDYERHKQHALLYMGHDPAVCAYACQIHISWALGYPETAMLHEAKAVELAQRLGHVPTLAFALSYVALIRAIRGEPALVSRATGDILLFSEEHKLLPFAALGHLLEGWARCASGCTEDGLEQMQKGFDLSNKIGARTWLPILISLHAESLLRAGRSREALEALDRALEIGRRSGERGWESRVLHLRGEVQLRLGDTDAAMMSMQTAVEVARRLQGKSWELRAATALARLWAERGKCHEATELLAPVHNGFTEGFGMADLKEAEVLLAEIA
ncbi:MAG: AAA family ATPase, partial [Woeseia sp.]